MKKMIVLFSAVTKVVVACLMFLVLGSNAKGQYLEKWSEKDGMIQFDVTSEGLSSDEWTRILNMERRSIEDAGVLKIVNSKEFTVTDNKT